MAASCTRAFDPKSRTLQLIETSALSKGASFAEAERNSFILEASLLRHVMLRYVLGACLIQFSMMRPNVYPCIE